MLVNTQIAIIAKYVLTDLRDKRKYSSNVANNPHSMEHQMTTTHQPIERISEGTVLEVPRFGAAEALSITFEGDSYVVEYARSPAGWDDTDTFTFKPGVVVECHDYQTFLRAESSLTEEEIEAKAEALKAIVAVTVIPWGAPISTGYRVEYSNGTHYATPVWKPEFRPFLETAPAVAAE